MLKRVFNMKDISFIKISYIGKLCGRRFDDREARVAPSRDQNQIQLIVMAAMPVYKDPYWLDFENMHFHWCLIAALCWTSDDFTTPV